MEEAIEVERGKWMLKIEEMRKLEKTKMEKEKQIWLHEAISRAMVEKNNQIESLLSRQGSLITECQRLRDTVKLLTDREQIRPG